MQTDELADQVMTSANGALHVLSIAIGDQLGLYAALQQHGPLTADGLAGHTGMAPRYAREWLEQQAVAGFLEVDDADADPDARRFGLSAEHAEVFANPDSLAYLAPLASLIGAAGAQLPALLDAYRTGGGVPWAAYGEPMRRAQTEMNRPWFLSVLGTEWLRAVPGLADRLAAAGRVADVGCGDGWSSIGMALAYPQITVDGYDMDAESVAAARANAAQHGVADRVLFHHGSAAAAEREARYDLVTAFECIHDLADPVAVLSAMHALAKPDGHVLAMDERTAERFTAPGDLVEQLLYGWSLSICLPDGLSTTPSAGTGTVMRPDTLRRYALEAGFSGVDVLPIENDLWRFYTLAL